MTITAAADGSALGNPGPAGWAWVIDKTQWRAGGWPRATNNQGELMAVLDLLRSTAHVPGTPLHVLCDSKYVIDSLTKWMPGWKRKGWRKADGKPVLNLELFKELDAELVGRTVTFEWVKGHAGHPLNEVADDLARAAATAFQGRRAANEGPGFSGGAQTASAPELVQAPAAAPSLFDHLDVTEQVSAVRFVSTGQDPAGAAEAAPLIETLASLERAHLRLNAAALRHADFVTLGDPGINAAQLAAALEATSATELTTGIAQLISRAGSVQISSLWLRSGDDWLVRFRQFSRD